MISLGPLGAPAQIAHRFRRARALPLRFRMTGIAQPGTWLLCPIAPFQKLRLLVAPLSLAFIDLTLATSEETKSI